MRVDPFRTDLVAAAARARDFQPPRWLRNAHLQSILPTLPPQSYFTRRRAAQLLACSQEHVIECGGGVRLLGFYSPQPTALRGSQHLVVLLHGWEGSADSNYVLSLGARLYELGCEVFRLNFRDHGASHHLNRELFHSCRLDEVVGAVGEIQRLFLPRRFSIGGFSLGGNFALRVASRAPSASIGLDRAIAICPVIRPHRTMAALESGWNIYRPYFIRKWKRSLELKQRRFPDVYRFDDVLALDTLTTMTEYLVRDHSEFADLDAYLRGYSLLDGVLGRLTVPSHVIAALDDPIVPHADAADLAAIPRLTVTLTEYGGHCGFLQALGQPSWADGFASQIILE